MEGVSGTVHEVGHALYEQGRPGGAMEDLPVSRALSTGVHESQVWCEGFIDFHISDNAIMYGMPCGMPYGMQLVYNMVCNMVCSMVYNMVCYMVRNMVCNMVYNVVRNMVLVLLQLLRFWYRYTGERHLPVRICAICHNIALRYAL